MLQAQSVIGAKLKPVASVVATAELVGATTNSIENKAALETNTIANQFPDLVQAWVNYLIPNGIVATGRVMGSIFLELFFYSGRCFNLYVENVPSAASAMALLAFWSALAKLQYIIH